MLYVTASVNKTLKKVCSRLGIEDKIRVNSLRRWLDVVFCVTGEEKLELYTHSSMYNDTRSRVGLGYISMC